jgi:anti-sigma B factor antagonist
VAPNESSSAVGPLRCRTPSVRRTESRTVVWLSGEHDSLTVDALSESLARAFALDDADVVLDLSGVQFMGAATIDVIVRAKDALDLRSRALTLRSPSESAQRVVDLCGLADLVEASSADARPLVGTNVGQ